MNKLLLILGLGTFIYASETTMNQIELIKNEVNIVKEDILKNKYKTNSSINLTDIYLNENIINYIFEVNYKKEVFRDKLNKSLMKNEKSLSDNKLRNLYESTMKIPMINKMKKGICLNGDTRKLLREGFIIRYQYKWEDTKKQFLIKRISEKDCKIFK